MGEKKRQAGKNFTLKIMEIHTRFQISFLAASFVLRGLSHEFLSHYAAAT